jgi:hypothetical protein
MSGILFREEKTYLVLESDLLWNDIYNTPDDDYRNYRELWLRLCSNISQIGMPVVLCGCAVPKQFEMCNGRRSFSSIYYLAVVSDDDVLEERMRRGRGVTAESWIKSSLDFNRWLKEHANETIPKIKLLDNTKLSPEEGAKVAEAWIRECMSNKNCSY